jgi:hypothetical protein
LSHASRRKCAAIAVFAPYHQLSGLAIDGALTSSLLKNHTQSQAAEQTKEKSDNL